MDLAKAYIYVWCTLLYDRCTSSAQVGQKYKLMLASTLNLDSSAMAGHYDVVRCLATMPSLRS